MEFLIGLLVALLVAGLVYWLATLIVGLLPIDPRVKQVILVIVAVILVLWLLTRLLALPGVAFP